MKRIIDFTCTCGHEILNAYADEADTRTCPRCASAMTQRWWGSSRTYAQWSDAEAVMVHINPSTGEVMYPADHRTRLREGYERVYLRSLPEVNKFEREHHVVNHVMHYDSNGRALDDTYRGTKMVH